LNFLLFFLKILKILDCRKWFFYLFKILNFLYIRPPGLLRCPRRQYNLLRLGYAFQALNVFPKSFLPRRVQLLGQDYAGSCMLTESLYKMTCGNYIEENKLLHSVWQSSLYSLLFPLGMVRHLRKVLCVKDYANIYIYIYELNWQFLEHSSNKVEISVLSIYFEIYFKPTPLCNGTKLSTKYPAHWSGHSFDWYLRISRKLMFCAIL